MVGREDRLEEEVSLKGVALRSFSYSSSGGRGGVGVGAGADPMVILIIGTADGG